MAKLHFVKLNMACTNGSDFTSRCHISITLKFELWLTRRHKCDYAAREEKPARLHPQLSLQNLNPLAPKQLLKRSELNLMFQELFFSCHIYQNSFWWIVWEKLDSVFRTAAMLCWISVASPPTFLFLHFWLNDFRVMKVTLAQTA